MLTFPIIEKLGGREAVFGALTRQPDGPKTIDALRMWAARGSIPGGAQRALMTEAESRGIAYTASDFEVVDLPDKPNGEAA